MGNFTSFRHKKPLKKCPDTKHQHGLLKNKSSITTWNLMSTMDESSPPTSGSTDKALSDKNPEPCPKSQNASLNSQSGTSMVHQPVKPTVETPIVTLNQSPCTEILSDETHTNLSCAKFWILN